MVRVWIFLLVVVAILVVAWNFFLPQILATTVRKRTGFEVSLVGLQANPFNGHLRIEGLVVSNPPGWALEPFVHVRDLEMTLDVGSLFGSSPVVERARIEVASVTLVTDASGRTNLQVFQERWAGPPPKPGTKPKPAPKPERPPAAPFLIRELDLKFDILEFIEAQRQPPVRERVALHLAERFENVSDVRDVVAVAMPGIDAVSSTLSALIPGLVGDVLGKPLPPAKPRREGVWRSMEKLEETRKP
jgi:uncharacterized protein involved in outer membrane biogenesis